MSEDIFVNAALRSAFYQKKLADVALDDWSSIPFTTKDELRQASAYDLLGAPIEDIATYHETSGTTGVPTPSWYSHADTGRELDVILRSKLNLNKNDILLNRFPFAMAIPSFILYWACQKAGAAHIGADKASLVTPDQRIVEIMQRAHPTILALLPSEAEKIFEVAKQLNIPFPTEGLRVLLLAGELVSPKRKQYFEKLWGVPVYTFFGSTETGGMFVSGDDGRYHLNYPNVRVEVVDDLGRPAGKGVRGHGVFSTTREGMPLLRYYNHDLLEIRDSEPDSDDPAPVLIHYGRDTDTIDVDGKSLTFYDLQEFIYSLDHVPLLWKVKQAGEHVTFILQYTNEVPLNEHDIQEEIRRVLDIDADVKLEDIIPLNKLVGKPVYSKYVHIEKTAAEEKV